MLLNLLVTLCSAWLARGKLPLISANCKNASCHANVHTQNAIPQLSRFCAWPCSATRLVPCGVIPGAHYKSRPRPSSRAPALDSRNPPYAPTAGDGPQHGRIFPGGLQRAQAGVDRRPYPGPSARRGIALSAVAVEVRGGACSRRGSCFGRSCVVARPHPKTHRDALSLVAAQLDAANKSNLMQTPVVLGQQR